MKMRLPIYFVVSVLLITSLTSCAKTKKWADPRNWRPQQEKTAQPAEASPQPDVDAQLDDLIKRHIESQPEAPSNKLIKKAPYYFKEYVAYPDGTSNYKIEKHKTDSRTRPLIAEVTLQKIRYATRATKNKDKARADHQYTKSIGEETVTCELRNGRWTLVSTVFVIAREQQVAATSGSAGDADERPEHESEKAGWLKRSTGLLTFWN